MIDNKPQAPTPVKSCYLLEMHFQGTKNTFIV